MDTNILVYADDPREQEKARIASSLVQRLIDEDLGIVSTQILIEYFNVTCARKRDLPPIFTMAQARDAVGKYLELVPCLEVTPEIVREAVRAAHDYRLRIFDAQIWATARMHGVPTIITEDTPGGRSRLEGIRYINPFARSFTLAALGL